MKAFSRSILFLVFAALTLFVAGCAPLQKYDVASDPAPRFAKAKSLEVATPILAMDEYQKIRTEYGNPNSKDDVEAKKYREVAGKALLDASLFGFETIDLTHNTTVGLNPVDKAAREDIQFKVGDRAHQAIKELLDHFSDTDAAKRALEPKWGDTKDRPLREAMEVRLDTRNAQLAKYKIIAGIVRATGSIPAVSYWLALVIIAVVVKGATMPLTLKMYKSQREMQKIQPLLKEIQAKYKDDRVKLNEVLMATYKEHKVNPFASCFPMLIQLPFLYLVYDMIRQYEFHFANGHFLWISPGLGGATHGTLGGNLAQFDLALLILYCASNYFTMRLTPPSDPQAAASQKQMSIMMTFVMFFMFMQYKWSSAFTLYWLILNIISTAQQYHYIYKPNKIKFSDAASLSGDGTATAPAPAFRDKPTAPRTNPSSGGVTKPSQSNLATPRPVSSGNTAGRPRAKGKGKKK